MSQAGVSSIAGVIGIPITVPSGGTGTTSFVPFAVITGGVTSTSPLQSVASVGTAGQILQSNGPGVLPSFETFAGGVTSVSGTANRITSTGGTTPVIDIAATYVGQTSITTLGTITIGTWQGSAVGPTFGGTGQTTYTTGDILYASAPNVLSKLPIGGNTQVLTIAAGIPSWATPTPGGVTSVSGTANRITSTGGATPVIDIAGTYVGQTSITTLGTITTGVWNGTAIGVTHGGTGLTSTTINQILYSSATNVIAGITAANNGTLISGTTGVPSWLANGTTGQVLTATTGSPPSWASPASAGISTVTGQTFTASGAFTYTPTSGMKYVIVELAGGGGGGGGCGNLGQAAGSSGGGGGYAKFVLTAAQVGSSLSGSVGAAGTGGASGNNNGTAGGNTTLATSSAWTVGGGANGLGSAGASGSGTTTAGGAGGTVTTGTGTILLSVNGGAGGSGTGANNGSFTFVTCGNGGGNPLGIGAPTLSTFANGLQNGQAASGKGGGGTGAVGSITNGSGGNGTAGVAIFTEFV